MTGKVCVQCEREMHPDTNSVVVVEWAGETPYKLWQADIWKCAGCGIEAVLGFANNPFAEHWQEKFEGLLKHAREKHRIINCYERQERFA